VETSPSPNGENDGIKRADRGRFAKGTCGGPGNPLGGLVWEQRIAFFKQLKKGKGVQKAVKTLLTAIEGKQLTPSQVIAIRELLDRAGCSVASMTAERRVEVEEQLTDIQDQIDEAGI
jgi:hypothetical protein